MKSGGQSATNCLLAGAGQQRWRDPAHTRFYGARLYHWLGREAHASRLKFYANKDLTVEGDLLVHVAHNDEGHVVKEVRSCRPNMKYHSHDMLVKWRGLDESENTWDTVSQLNEDVPPALRVYALRHREDPVIKDITSELKILLGEVKCLERIRLRVWVLGSEFTEYQGVVTRYARVRPQ